jgi:hypothetical protein
MIVGISSGAEADISDGYWFYERQSIGLGDYFCTCIFADVESLAYTAGIHESENGFHRCLGKQFPFGIYYTVADEYCKPAKRVKGTNYPMDRSGGSAAS